MKVNCLHSQYILTADIGGSHITAAVCNIETNTIIPGSFTRTELRSKGSAKSIFFAWNTSLQQAAKVANKPIGGLGVAMPGPFDYEKGISYIKGLNKYEALYGLNIKNYLADALQLDASLIRFRNDAEATVTGEVLAGAGNGLDGVMGVTLGTGFGSAHCINGVTKDLNLGSMAFKDSIADDYLSTRWFLKRYFELTGLSVSGVKELALLADTSVVVRQIFKEFAINMSDYLSDYVEQTRPQILVLCGNIAKASALFVPLLRRRLPAMSIRLAQLGEQAALIGAAGLFKHQEDQVTL